MEEGRVIGIEGKNAVIALEKSANCNGCKACCSLSQDSEDMMLATVDNTLGAVEGDRIKLEISSSQIVLASTIVYLMPIIFFLAGYLIGALILAGTLSTDPQGTGIITAFTAMAGSLFLVRFIENKRKGFFKPKMVKILN